MADSPTRARYAGSLRVALSAILLLLIFFHSTAAVPLDLVGAAVVVYE